MPPDDIPKNGLHNGRGVLVPVIVFLTIVAGVYAMVRPMQQTDDLQTQQIRDLEMEVKTLTSALHAHELAPWHGEIGARSDALRAQILELDVKLQNEDTLRAVAIQSGLAELDRRLQNEMLVRDELVLERIAGYHRGEQ